MTRLLIVFFLSQLAVSAAPLRDVPSSHWAKNDVDKLVNEYGFMQGDPNGYFGGSRALSRYEFAKTISRLVEYYNAEIDSDRKDIENMVSIMELFQNELKSTQGKLDQVSQNLNEQNQIINEINEIAVTLGEEIQSDDEKEALMARMSELEQDIDKLQNKGLVIDTLVKGTFNDIKKLGKATARVVSRTRSNVGGPNIQYKEEEYEEVIEEIPQYMDPTETIPQPRQDIQMTTPVEGTSDSLYNPYDVEIMEDIGQ